MSKRKVRTFVAGLVAAGIVAGVAAATPPSGQVGVLVARGTVAEQFKVTVPKVVTVTKVVKVKRHGKLVSKRVKVKKTIDSPLIACGSASQCDVVHQSITYQPGGFSGWHSHPGIVLVAVKTGAITRFPADCAKQTYSAGQGFVELGPTQTVFVKNETTAVTVVEATLIVPAGTANPALRIDQAAPSGCTP